MCSSDLTTLFSHLNDEDLQEVANDTLFETYGKFDWHLTYNMLQSKDKAQGVKDEPVIANQGDYPDGILLVRAGFARVSIDRGNGHQTLTYLGTGDFYGADELYRAWQGDSDVSMRVTITALGYAEMLRVPTKTVEKHLFAYWSSEKKRERKNISESSLALRRLQDFIDQTSIDGALMVWAAE